MPSEQEPFRLGDFEIVREVGRGGMGVVYEARQVSLNRKVALKVLAGGLGLTSRAVERFQREAEAAAKLHHTNIVPVYATSEQDGTHFYAMELIAGPSLDQVLRQLRQGNPNPAPTLAQTTDYVEGAQTAEAAGLNAATFGSASSYFDTVARMIAEVADALDHAHKQGVVHRDIKPSNLLLSPDGRLSINDFGLARMLEQPGMTMTGEFVGTPLYVSPEQIAAGRTPLDHRTDIYSLGATLYELLTLQPPFSGERRDQVLAQILHKDPTPPRKINRKVPIDLETICLKALEKDPDRRYPTAGEMAQDLRAFVKGFAIKARRLGLVERMMKWARRRPALAVALTGFVLALVLAGVLGYQAHRAEQRGQAALEQARQELLASKLEESLVAALGGELERLEKLLTEAENLGAPIGHVRRLRGLVRLQRGEVNKALHLLGEAVKEDPENYAAHALLLLCYSSDGQWNNRDELAGRIKRLQPISMEDRLLEAFLKGRSNPEIALPVLDQAVQQRSRLACALRAYTLARVALKRGEKAVAERALADAHRARGLLPDNAFVLTISLRTHLAAAVLLWDDAHRREEVLNQAGHEVAELEAYPLNEEAGHLRWAYHDLQGKDSEATTIARWDYQRSGRTHSYLQLAASLHREGKIQEALVVLEQPRKDDDLNRDEQRAYLLAESPCNGPEEALAACQAWSQDPELSASAQIRALRVLLLLGKTAMVREESRRLLRAQTQKGAGESLFRSSLEFLAGRITESQLLEHSRSSRYSQTHSLLLIALQRLSEGERQEARKRLEELERTRMFESSAYNLGRTFLKRIQGVPEWPHWLDTKK